MLLLVVELLLLALAIIEPPAVPIDGFTAPPLVSGIRHYPRRARSASAWILF